MGNMRKLSSIQEIYLTKYFLYISLYNMNLKNLSTPIPFDTKVPYYGIIMSSLAMKNRRQGNDWESEKHIFIQIETVWYQVISH
jgi:hypothetical protein